MQTKHAFHETNILLVVGTKSAIDKLLYIKEVGNHKNM